MKGAVMRALSIRQPWAELILRGVKTVEYRSRPTRIIGERFYIYAAKKPAPAIGAAGSVWSRDLAMATAGKPGEGPPAWMLELAELLILGKLPTGLIVGSATIARCTGPVHLSDDDGVGQPFYEWHLSGVERLDEMLKPAGHPQPVWFEPF
jgi:hypothetical protein